MKRALIAVAGLLALGACQELPPRELKPFDLDPLPESRLLGTVAVTTFEDMRPPFERELLAIVGPEGSWLHIGRSRQDMLSTGVSLWLCAAHLALFDRLTGRIDVPHLWDHVERQRMGKDARPFLVTLEMPSRTVHELGESLRAGARGRLIRRNFHRGETPRPV